MIKAIYDIFVRLYPSIIKITAPFNPKAKLWIKGRTGLLPRIKNAIAPREKLIWMHCASLGEFEQGRPVLEKLKQEYPSYKILLTFFSPSGFEVRKDYNGADYIFYLPPDNRKNAQVFLEITNPRLVIFVKYEFWYYYLTESKKRKIPLLLISAIFRNNQPFFSWFGSFHRTMLSCFTYLFVQNMESVLLLRKIGFTNNVALTGDTRFDRVIEIAEKFRPISFMEGFCAQSEVIVAGSTWLEDDKELAHYVNTRQTGKFIIAPHNIGKERLNECLKLYKNSTLFSSLNSILPSPEVNTIIIDNIGMLSRLYKYATICYVGGGFGADGVHNVLEAAVFGKPVVFGPEYKKFNEATELIKSGGAISVGNTLELERTFNTLFTDSLAYNQSAKASLAFVYGNGGSTEKILRYIYEKRLLTN